MFGIVVEEVVDYEGCVFVCALCAALLFASRGVLTLSELSSSLG